jgi:tRNA(Leu) C34 or U34 (ribose-2'-O)-methylase TrmL
MTTEGRPAGVTPAVCLINPKYPHNVGNALRACSCFDARQLWWTGARVTLDVKRGERLPREERMKGYRDVEMVRDDRVFDRFGREVVPVAVELRPGAESLVDFDHPEHALYVFGPEDGSIPRWALPHCHRFIIIPTAHCLNLASAVNVVLYDRRCKRQRAGLEEALPPAAYLGEHRGPAADGDELFVGISAAGRGAGYRAHARGRRAGPP